MRAESESKNSTVEMCPWCNGEFGPYDDTLKDPLNRWWHFECIDRILALWKAPFEKEGDVMLFCAKFTVDFPDTMEG